jgi:hypothetical protein
MAVKLRPRCLVGVAIGCVLLAGCGTIRIDVIPASDPEGGAAGAGGASGAVPGLAGQAGASGAVAGASGYAGAAATGGAGAVGGSGDTGGVAGGGAGGAGGGQAGQAAAGMAGAATVSGPSGYCRELPSLGNAPTIDGSIEPGLSLQSVDPAGWTGDGTVPPGHSMDFVVAWRPDGIYFFVQIQDPDRNPAEPTDRSWMGDGVEIYIDSDGVFPPAPGYDDPGARQFTIAAPSDESTPSTRAQVWIAGYGGERWRTSQFAAVPTPQGYNVEAFVEAVDLSLASWESAAGDLVGFDLGHDVSVPPGEEGTSGNRDGQYFLRVQETTDDGLAPRPFENENAFCRATLLGSRSGDSGVAT